MRCRGPSTSRRSPRALAAPALCAALSGGLVGCGGNPAPPPIRPEYDLHHPSGTIRAQAVAAVGARRDVSQVPALIEALDDEDEAVRLSAAVTLREVTGHDTGYQPYLPRSERRRHVALWRAWWAQRAAPGPTVPPTPAAAPSPAAAPCRERS